MAMISVTGLGKEFTLHTQGGVRILVFSGLDMEVNAGECVCLYGPSGSGKSTLLRSLYANYKPTTGRVSRSARALVTMTRRRRGRRLLPDQARSSEVCSGNRLAKAALPRSHMVKTSFTSAARLPVVGAIGC